MFAFLNNLFGKTRTARQARSYRPSFDDLESRQLMSVSSTAIHAVASPGAAQASVFYFDNKHLLAVNGQELSQNVKNTPHGIESFSAGLDAIGSPDVFVKASDNSIWEWNEGDWTKVLGPANNATSFAAVNGNRAYAIYADGSLHEFNGDAWSKVPGSGKVLAIDAITDGRGNDAVFALNSNGTFGEYFGGHFDQLLPANDHFGRFPVSIGAFSAATDAQGDAIVYGSIIARIGTFKANLGVYELNLNGTQTFIASDVTHFSGTDGALWLTESNGDLYKFDGGGLHSEPGDTNGNVSLSAANSNDVFWVSSSAVTETTLGVNGDPTEVISYQDYGHVAQ